MTATFHSINLKQLQHAATKKLGLCIRTSSIQFHSTLILGRRICKGENYANIYAVRRFIRTKTGITRTNFPRDCFSAEQRFRIVTRYLSGGGYWNFKLAIEYNGVRASSLCRPIMTATSLKSSAMSAFQLYI